jgi:hypothetical protein
MILFSENISSRLEFVCEFIGKEILNQPIRVTNERSTYLSYDGPKINYGNYPLTNDELQIVPHKLLFETDITKQEVNCKVINGNKALFVSERNGYPFDIFAAIFYLLSRYEEYLPHSKDEYGRYSYKESVAFKEGFLHLPLINFWLEDFKLAVREKFPAILFYRKTFKFIPSYDIDIAWKYKHKGLWRNIGGCLESAFKGTWTDLKERIAVLQDNQKDPFEAYEWLDALHLYCRLKPYYFFILS